MVSYQQGRQVRKYFVDFEGSSDTWPILLFWLDDLLALEIQYPSVWMNKQIAQYKHTRF